MTVDFKNKTYDEVWLIRQKAQSEMEHRLFDRLAELAGDYSQLYGRDTGIEIMGEKLCNLANKSNLYSKGWSGLINYLKVASG